MALEGGTLVLWLENVRAAGVVQAGELRLLGVTSARSWDERYDPDTYPLQGGLSVVGAEWAPGRVILRCTHETGPADVEHPRFEIGFASLSHGLRPSLGRTLRGLLGAYPARADRGRHFQGSGRITMAALREPH